MASTILLALLLTGLGVRVAQAQEATVQAVFGAGGSTTTVDAGAVVTFGQPILGTATGDREVRTGLWAIYSYDPLVPV